MSEFKWVFILLSAVVMSAAYVGGHSRSIEREAAKAREDAFFMIHGVSAMRDNLSQ